MSSLVKFPQRPPGFLAPPSEQKALTQMVHGYGTLPMFSMLPADTLLPSSKPDYARQVGDGLGSSVLMAPLNWMMRTFPEAPHIVQTRNDQRQWEEVSDHALTALISRPNDFYSGLLLMMATVLDLCFGNAFWLKIRNELGEVVQLWWVPRMMMDPRWNDPKVFIDHYDYFAGGQTVPVDPRDVVHFRFGLDPRNIRLGLSPLGSLARDIVMDDQAADFATAILKNLGVIGVVISPEIGGAVSKPALQETKEWIQENFSGDRRGNPLALPSPTKVQLLQYQMQGFDVSPLRDVSEERVCAALGIPAAVVGFGTGLQQTKVGATMKEMRQLAWYGGLMPMQKIVADEVKRSLLTDKIYVDGTDPYAPASGAPIRMAFDTSTVFALAEEAGAKHDRVRKDYLAGIIMRSEARVSTGRGAAKDGSDDVYVQPVNVTQLDDNGTPKPSPSSATNQPDPTEDNGT